MKILIVTSKRFYDTVKPVSEELTKLGHEIIFPNCINNKNAEQEAINADISDKFKQTMFKESIAKIQTVDAILVLNYNTVLESAYIGGATFLEIYEAWKAAKKIFILNPITNSSISTEIKGFNPIILDGDIKNIK